MQQERLPTNPFPESIATSTVANVVSDTKKGEITHKHKPVVQQARSSRPRVCKAEPGKLGRGKN